MPGIVNVGEVPETFREDEETSEDSKIEMISTKTTDQSSHASTVNPKDAR